ncbi:hypothetical protein MMYC01_209605 [Madurella mycetomatis]|uniref:Rhodopsin domain-containing protein n=1 Tax=Madurella mycetomatis TaxID=100816 RepID=A0A175VR27_9PEZI|nr:hypothetical protein MMYC01_209605 [Madurella mycetomatis]
MAAPGSVLPPDIAAQNKGPAILAACITVTTLSTLFVLGRLFVRAHIIRKMYLDDYFMIAALICSWATVGTIIRSVSYGTGRHVATLSEDQLSAAILWTMVGFCPGVMSFGLPKLAVVALLTRMLNVPRWHAILMWSLAILCLTSLLGCVVLLFAQCTPTHAMWDFTVKRECWSPWVLVDYSIFAGSFSAFMDLYFAVYPAIVLFQLQLDLRKRIALSCALGIGSVATVVAIYKTTRLPGLASPDFIYDTADLTIWTAIEASTIMIAASIPILRPLIDFIFGRRVFSSHKSYLKYQKYGRSRSGRAETDIEMARSAGRSSKRDKRDGTTTSHLDTVIGSASCEAGHCTSNKGDGNDSQVSILPDKVETHAPPPSRSMSGGIMRTDQVTVTTSAYDADADRTLSAGRWD